MIMRILGRYFRYGEKGFTLIELLVVIAILGIIAAVAVPNVGKFIGRGKTEAMETELHNIQTGLTALLADAATNNLTSTGNTVAIHGGNHVLDLSSVTATDPYSNVLTLNNYITGLGDSPATTAVETDAPKTGCSYDFTSDGRVTQWGP
jgi:prepilin-type N-terminal cleavage/methylation domain-containing protein